MHEAYDTRRVPNPPPQVFQLRKIDALWSMHTAHFARLYIYIYISPRKYIYIYIYILKKIIRAPPYEIISGKNRGGVHFPILGQSQGLA